MIFFISVGVANCKICVRQVIFFFSFFFFSPSNYQRDTVTFEAQGTNSSVTSPPGMKSVPVLPTLKRESSRCTFPFQIIHVFLTFHLNAFSKIKDSNFCFKSTLICYFIIFVSNTCNQPKCNTAKMFKTCTFPESKNSATCDGKNLLTSFLASNGHNF